MKKIIITGPECSGKTTLCVKIANHFNVSYNTEKARDYLTKINRKYKKSDLLNIAKKQVFSEKKSTILDTDLITIKIWSEQKYNYCDKWIIKSLEKQKKEERFYLLCKPDIPWVYDTLRESPNERDKLFKIYNNVLEELEHEYFIVSGKDRLDQSILEVSRFLNQL